MTKIGKLIKKTRIQQMLSQQELGEMIGVGAQYISNIERGQAMPPKRRFHKLVKGLKLDRNQAYIAFNNDIMKKLKMYQKKKHTVLDEHPC